jgi:insertion element IS1 protein InsB
MRRKNIDGFSSSHLSHLQSAAMVIYGKTPDGTQRFHGQNPSCHRRTFLMEYTPRGFRQEIKQQSVDLALHGSGIRDTARVLGMSPTTVIDT